MSILYFFLCLDVVVIEFLACFINYNLNIYISENLTNDHETPERPKPSTSIPRYQNKSGKYLYIS